MKIDFIHPPKPEPQIVLTLTPSEAALVAIAISGNVGGLGTSAIYDAFNQFNSEEEYFGNMIHGLELTEPDLRKMFVSIIETVREAKKNV